MNHTDTNKTDHRGPADCEICGAEFFPSWQSRCRECRRLCCRDCLKITYEPASLTGASIIVGVRCYQCHHS